MVKKNFLKSSLIIALAVITALTVAAMLPNKVSAASNDSETVSLTYSAHMQTYGDGSVVKAGSEVTETPTSFAGVTGESKRMESLTMAFEGPTGVSLKYQAHVQGLGWTTEVPVTKEGTTFVGTKGQSKRVEAVKITVVGLDKLTNAGYEIKYRAHVQGEGWQDWVTADANKYNETERNFAGTKGESKRIEAIEIVLVHVHNNQYVYTGPDNDPHHIRTCNLCGEVVTEPCEYGEWDSTDGTKAVRVCACGHKEEKTLKAVLNDESVTELEVSKVNTTLTVPAGKTLIVGDDAETECLGTSAVVTVKGTLVLKGTTNDTTQLKGNGTVIWAPELEKETDFAEVFPNTQFLKLSGDKLDKDNSAGEAKNLKFEIRVPELSKPQTITDSDNAALTLGKGWNVTIDLGKNTLATGSSQTSGLLVNKGNLTIKNGTLKDTTSTTGNYTIKNGVTTEAKDAALTLENVKIESKDRGISTIGTLSMTDCEIKGTKANNSVGLSVGYSDAVNGEQGEMNKKPVTLVNVKISGVDCGVIAHSKNASMTLTNCNVEATKFALHTNAKSPATNNTFIVTGGTYKVTDPNGSVAYLAATGKSTFSNCTLEGANGIETAGSALTLDGVTVNATGTANNDGKGTVEQGKSTASGSAVILKVCSGYGDSKAKAINLTVTNSKLTSKNGYVVNVAAATILGSNVEKINISYDQNTLSKWDGKLGFQVIADTLKDKTTSSYVQETAE